MAGFSGNNAVLAVSKQSSKGSYAASIQFVTKFTGGDIDFDREVARFDETSGTRDVGNSYVQLVNVAGSPAVYLRPTDAVTWLEGVLGSRSSSGATNFTHTITPSDTQVPYLTLWQSLGGNVLANQFKDCVIDSARIAGGVGQPLELTMAVMGLDGRRISTGYPGTPTTETPLLYHQVTVTKGGVAKTSVNSFELSIENNHVVQQGNGSLAAYDVAPGERRIAGQMSLLFEDINDYDNFHFGSTSGTTPASTIYTEALTITATVNSNLSIAFTLPSVAYTAYKVTPDKGGAPIVANVNFEGEPSGSAIITAVVKNQTAGASYNGV